GRLFNLGRHGTDERLRKQANWALASLPLAERGSECWCAEVLRADLEFPERASEQRGPVETEEIAALVVAWYLRALPDEEIAGRAQTMIDSKGGQIDSRTTGRTLHELLERVTGERALQRRQG